MLADSHCHLDLFKRPGPVVSRALKAGVERILSGSTSHVSIALNLGLSRRFPCVSCCIGIHPSNVLSMKESEIEKAFADAGENVGLCAAIGEVGLDFKHAASQEQRALQERVFKRFVSIAIEAGKPVTVHARYAESGCLDILEEMGAKKVHMHWFTNSKKTSARAVSLGYFISCGPIIFSDVPSAEVVKSIPLENLLLETDAPVPFGGKRSEPSWIPGVCAKVAELKGISTERVSEATGKNFLRLFT